MLRNFLKEYFQFTPSERIGTIVLSFLIILLLSISIIYPKIRPKPQVDFSEFENDIKQWKASSQQKEVPDSYNKSGVGSNKGITYQLFTFDPNTISKTDLKRLGLNDRITNTLLKYREKGGIFYQNEHLKKIYGMNDSIFAALEPYIEISIVKEVAVNTFDSTFLTRPQFEKILIDINSADSLQLLDIYGIGPTFASRIIKYRALLGGYIRKDQLMEVYGFQLETYEEIESNITVDTSLVNKIVINTADFNQLIRHPYLNKYQVNAILEFRNIQGQIINLDELRENNLLPDDVFQKISPYLELSEGRN
ncbi:MAG: helix-hairpin-helix domain-containing protein [Bacteroidales bacterium]|nr:helix-hairpin-helix domain-containing protein [Bacteroidales bacterium]